MSVKKTPLRPKKCTQDCVLGEKYTNSPQPTTESDPDSQTARHQARNSASGCNAARSLHQSTGFAI